MDGNLDCDTLSCLVPTGENAVLCQNCALSHQKVKMRVNLLPFVIVSVCVALLWGAELGFCGGQFIPGSESGCWF